MVNAPCLVALVQAGATFVNRKLIERPGGEAAEGSPAGNRLKDLDPQHGQAHVLGEQLIELPDLLLGWWQQIPFAPPRPVTFAASMATWRAAHRGRRRP